MNAKIINFEIFLFKVIRISTTSLNKIDIEYRQYNRTLKKNSVSIKLYYILLLKNVKYIKKPTEFNTNLIVRKYI